MKTDQLFYELFRFSPESLFELVRLPVRGRYRFESITVKTTEKRFYGFLGANTMTILIYSSKSRATRN